MRDVAARLFALEQGKTRYRSTKWTVQVVCAGSKRVGDRQVKIIAATNIVDSRVKLTDAAA